MPLPTFYALRVYLLAWKDGREALEWILENPSVTIFLWGRFKSKPFFYVLIKSSLFQMALLLCFTK